MKPKENALWQGLWGGHGAWGDVDLEVHVVSVKPPPVEVPSTAVYTAAALNMLLSAVSCGFVDVSWKGLES